MRLEARDLCVERGGRVVLHDLSFTLESGESLIVTGQNGAGKSTLLRTLAGLVPMTRGRLIASPQTEEELAERLHYIGHADAFKGTLTPIENLTFWAAMLRTDAPPLSPRAALGELGIEHLGDLPSAYLSAGQRRRLSLARLLVAARPLWLLDEPTTALDQASQDVLFTLMRKHIEKGGSIIAATHAPLDLPGRTLSLTATDGVAA
ncbi:heme ABC exporter ATP-binding protein CcmA [Beijerinckia indica]|uniref:Heme exporter protein CcmA n=1 Tax=Beijerinckia indica subsp. indica (strain ATCC 9039 / DSM 1715 / NCIMB 8712) TaxID=395963 RepID=B2IJ59_BEII9|nr:heme ABC exporter ATP-binding protein CcmA [Beijerinckia indica]ACB94822.1 heme exporter protein CcmA [Beijerinckia indica subsp. indica ATCC 9039]